MRRLGVGALLVAHDDDRSAAERADAADDGRILGEVAVAGERREVVDQRLDVGSVCGRSAARATSVFCQGVSLA